jgi:hypothetical protein
MLKYNREAVRQQLHDCIPTRADTEQNTTPHLIKNTTPQTLTPSPHINEACDDCTSACTSHMNQSNVCRHTVHYANKHARHCSADSPAKGQYNWHIRLQSQNKHDCSNCCSQRNPLGNPFTHTAAHAAATAKAAHTCCSADCNITNNLPSTSPVATLPTTFSIQSLLSLMLLSCQLHSQHTSPTAAAFAAATAALTPAVPPAAH